LVGNPALQHHRIVCDIEQLFERPTGIDIGFIVPNLELFFFAGSQRVRIFSFIGIERIRSLLGETILETMGNEVVVCLCTFECVIMVVEVSLGLYSWM